jgi:general secretion pathway protein D
VLHRDAEEMAELIRTFSDATISATSDAQASAGPLDGADFSIAVDGPTRSLVVRADPQTHKAIREVLEVLDAPVELVAVDITVSELRTPESYGFLFGFQIPFAKGSGTGDLLGFVQSAPAVGGAAAFPTLTGRVQRSTDVIFQPPGAPIPIAIPIETSIGALDFDGTNEVLIQPSLIVTAGERHEIFVGDNVGIPVSDPGTGGDGLQTIGGVNVSALSQTTSFERTDIGTRLAIEVRTGAEGKIQLDLEVEISAIDLTRAGLAGNPTEVGPSYTKKNLVVTARLDDGESAVLAVSKRQTETEIDSGIPFLRDLPYLGFLFGAKGTTVEDVRLMISARARRVSNPAELVADTIRRRLTFERRRARGAGMPAISGPPFAVRVTTRQLEEDAKAIADSIALRGFETQVHSWELSGNEVFDVYVMHLSSMVDAAEVAEGLGEDGWDADLVVFPQTR